MKITFEQIAPSAVVMAFAGYCAWPSLSALMSEPPPPPPQRKTAALTDASFTPKLPPMPTKNPFGGRDAATLAAEREKALAAALAAAKEAEAAAAAAAASDKAEETVAADGPASPLDGLRLDGTFLVGDRRWAVINGRVYGRLDDLATDNSKYPLQVADVLPHKVLLKYKGRNLELAYSNIASLFAPSAQALAEGSNEAADAPAIGKSDNKTRPKRKKE